MRAVTLPAYGGPEALVLTEVEAPTVGEDEVLVDVAAASINSADLRIVRGEPFVLRLAMGLARPKLVALGADVAGTVRAVGARVRELAVGDEVIADLSGCGFGAFAEQVRAPARVWVKKPRGLSLTEAAAVPMAGMTALQGLRDVAGLQPGDRALIVGATGGVGSFAVQIARALGAEVSATSRAEKAELLVRLGVSDIIDSSALDEHLAKGERDGRYAVILDFAATRSPFAYRRVLAKGGRYICVGGPSMGPLFKVSLLGPLVGRLTGRRFRGMFQSPSRELLADVVRLIEEAEVRPVIDRVFPLEEVREALRHVEDRRTRGKVVLSIGA